MGEEGFLDFAFETYCGKVVVEPTDEAMTPFGGLVPWAAFQKKSGILDRLAETCPVTRTSPNAAPVYDVLASFVLTALCDGSRFVHVDRLRHDPALPELLGMEGVVGDDTIRRFLKSLRGRDGCGWVAGASRPLWSALPSKFILDWDSTVQTRYGHQEGAAVGYNPTKRGRPSHHPLVAVVAGTRLCAYYRWRPGNSHTAGEWKEAMEECLDWLGPDHRPWLNRGDIGFGGEAMLSWHEEAANRPQYLFKLRLTRTLKRAMASVPEEAWQGESAHGVLQVAEAKVKLSGWSRERRVIFGRRLQGVIPAKEAGAFWDVVKHEYEAYVTDLEPDEANAWQIVDLYRQRADAENVFDELKNHWGFGGFCCKDRVATEMAARLLLLTYNLWNLFLRLLEPARHVEAFQARRWFLLIAARMVKSGGSRTVKISVADDWRRVITDGYRRVCQWLSATAPQLGSAGGFPRLATPDCGPAPP
jgi:hypothetical protein